MNYKVSLPNKSSKKLTGKQLLRIIEQVCKDKTTVISDEFRSYGILDNKKENRQEAFADLEKKRTVHLIASKKKKRWI